MGRHNGLKLKPKTHFAENILLEDYVDYRITCWVRKQQRHGQLQFGRRKLNQPEKQIAAKHVFSVHQAMR